MLIYRTEDYKGYQKHSYHWYEYHREGDRIIKYKHSKQKFFDGNENVWEEEEKIVDSWDIDDPTMPEWLRNYL